LTDAETEDRNCVESRHNENVNDESKLNDPVLKSLEHLSADFEDKIKDCPCDQETISEVESSSVLTVKSECLEGSDDVLQEMTSTEIFTCDSSSTSSLPLHVNIPELTTLQQPNTAIEEKPSNGCQLKFPDSQIDNFSSSSSTNEDESHEILDEKKLIIDQVDEEKEVSRCDPHQLVADVKQTEIASVPDFYEANDKIPQCETTDSLSCQSMSLIVDSSENTSNTSEEDMNLKHNFIPLERDQGENVKLINGRKSGMDELIRRLDETDPTHKLRSLCKRGDLDQLDEFLKEKIDLVSFQGKVSH